MTSFLKQNAFKITISSLILLTLGVYWQSAQYGFVWDDEVLYINEEHFPQNDRWANFEKFWIPGGQSMYAPVTYSFWSVLASLGSTEKHPKFDPKPFHVFNICVHIINALLVFFILSHLVTNYWYAWLGALFFAVHPVQAEAVSWISEARGLLAAMFGFLAVYYFIRHRVTETERKRSLENHPKNKPKKEKVRYIIKKKNPHRYIIFVFVSFLLSILSKPSGVAFAGIIFLIDLFYFKTHIRKIIPVSGILILIALPFSILSNLRESTFAVQFAATSWQKPFIFFDTIVFYIQNIIFPVNLAACYGRTPGYLAGSPWLYLSTLLVITLIALFVLFRKKDKKFLFAFLIFVAGYLPLSGLITFNFQYWSTVADRYIYPSMLGGGLAFAYIMEKFGKEKSGIIFGLSVTVVLAFLCSSQVRTWESELTLWDNTIEKYPENSANPYNARGFIYLNAKRYHEALSDFNKAIKLNPNEGLAYYNRGNIYFDFKDYDKALKDFSKAVNLRPNHTEAYINRGLTCDALEKYNEAVNDFSKAISLQPKQSDIYLNRGVDFAKLGEMQKAINDFKMTLKLNPNDKEAAEYLRVAENTHQKIWNN